MLQSGFGPSPIVKYGPKIGPPFLLLHYGNQHNIFLPLARVFTIMKSSLTQCKGKGPVKVTRSLCWLPVASPRSGITQMAPLLFLDYECS